MKAIEMGALCALLLSTACTADVDPDDMVDPLEESAWTPPAGATLGHAVAMPDGTCATYIAGDFFKAGASNNVGAKWYDVCGSGLRGEIRAYYYPSAKERGSGDVRGFIITSEGKFELVGRYRRDTTTSPPRATISLYGYDGKDLIAFVDGQVFYESGTSWTPDRFEAAAQLY
jgi:hypothetical protein